jgi:aryl-alcohol dehydrogenase-like predicted oxidoreductase
MGADPTRAYTTLGTTGVQVSRLCLGTMMFGANGNTDVPDCTRIVHAALDAGINFIDTADVYGNRGGTEEILGAALADGRREHVVLATKGHFPMGEDRNMRGNSRRWIRQAVEGSLRRLRTDRIDLYQLHRPDPRCDIDESLGVLSDLVREGKLLMIGTSTFPAAQLVEAQWTAERRARERFVTEQSPYSILVRAIEADVLPTARRHKLGVLAWSPLCGGWLAGKYRAGVPATASWRTRFNASRFDTSSPAGHRKAQIVEQLARLAEQAGLSLVHLALRFVLEHPAVTAAIIGPRTLEQLQGQLGATGARLPRDVLDEIDRLVAPGEVVNPADFGATPDALSLHDRRQA